MNENNEENDYFCKYDCQITCQLNSEVRDEIFSETAEEDYRKNIIDEFFCKDLEEELKETKIPFISSEEKDYKEKMERFLGKIRFKKVQKKFLGYNYV